MPERDTEPSPPPTTRPRRRTEGTSDVVFEQASDAIIVTDADVVVTGWNPAAEQIYGIKASAGDRAAPRQPPGCADDGWRGRRRCPGDAVRRNGRWRGRIVQRPLRRDVRRRRDHRRHHHLRPARPGRPLRRRDQLQPRRDRDRICSRRSSTTLGSLAVATGRADRAPRSPMRHSGSWPRRPEPMPG